MRKTHEKNSDDFINNNQSFMVQDVTLPLTITENFVLYACLQKTDEKAVYLIHSKFTEELSILKTCSSECKEDLAQEYMLLKSLNHPSIPKAYFYSEENGNKYFIREYFEGQTLFQILEENGSFDANEAIKIVLQLCGVMHYLHTHKPPVIHRDIKPQNVICSSDHTCKLIDFGIARFYRDDNQNDTVVIGTRNTAAPEQYGYKQTSNKSDIYSLGVLLLYMLTGSFDIDRIDSIQNKRLKNIISKSIRFDPKDRYTSVLHLYRRLKSALLFGHKLFRVALAGSLLAVAVVLAIIGFSLFPGAHGSDFVSAKQSAKAPVTNAPVVSGTITPHRSAEPEQSAKPELTPEAEQTGAPVQPNGSVIFSSSLVEEAVRHELGLSKTDPITQAELDKVTKILICGTTVYDNWEDNSISNSSYFVNGKLCDDEGTISSLDDIAKLKNLSELALFNQQIEDLSSLKGLHLAKLGLGGNAIRDISALSDFVNMTELYLENNPIKDITPLTQMRKLSVLNIENTYVKDISVLSTMPLQRLSLMGTPVEDYSALKHLDNILELSVSELDPEDIDICTSRTSLIKLWIYSSHITDINTFRRLKNLMSIDAYDNDIQSLSGIDRFTHLNTLCIEANPITDLTPIIGTDINILNIAKIPVTDYSKLTEQKILSLIFCNEQQRAAIEKACEDLNVQIITK